MSNKEVIVSKELAKKKFQVYKTLDPKSLELNDRADRVILHPSHSLPNTEVVEEKLKLVAVKDKNFYFYADPKSAGDTKKLIEIHEVVYLITGDTPSKGAYVIKNITGNVDDLSDADLRSELKDKTGWTAPDDLPPELVKMILISIKNGMSFEEVKKSLTKGADKKDTSEKVDVANVNVTVDTTEVEKTKANTETKKTFGSMLSGKK